MKIKVFLNVKYCSFSGKNQAGVNFNVLYNADIDYYKLLEINDKAKDIEVKAAFYKISMKVHPDKGGKEEDFKAINNAYEVLKNKELRDVYDKLKDEYYEDLEKRNKRATNKKSNFTDRKDKNEKHNRDYAKYSEDYTKHQNSYRTYSHKYDNAKADYKNDFKYTDESKDFDERYKDFLEFLKKFAKFQERYKKEFKDSTQFSKFKTNYSYINLDGKVLYDKFITNSSHKIHLENRKARLKSPKDKSDPFAIDSSIDSDSEYIKLLNSNKDIEDDEGGNNERFKLKDLIKLLNKSSLTILAVANIIGYYIFFVK